MKVGYKKLGVVLGAVAALALMPARADAQFVRYSPVFWSFDGGAGIAIPLGDLSDNSSSGPSFGIGASYFLNPNFALRAEGGLSLLGESDTAGGLDPDLQIWTFTGGVEYHISDPTSSLLFAFDVGVGGATFDTEIFTVNNFPGAGDTTSGNFGKTYLAATGGLKLGYNFARNGSTGVPMATLYINGDLTWISADESDTALFAAFNGTSGFGTALMIPITAGLRINIP